QKLATREALQRANDLLELKVRQRTAELEQAHEELVQAGKLALLGQMSAGISHELGQPLTALRGLAGNARQLIAGRLRDERVVFDAVVPPGLAAHCDATRLEQVLVNLSVNALDAM